MSRGAGALTAALLALACGEGRVWVESPPGAEGGSMLLSLEGAANPLPPIASALRGPVELVLEGEVPEGARLVARVFDESLEALDLEAGEIETVASGGRALQHTQSFVRALTAEDGAAWEEANELTLMVSSPITPCPRLEVIAQPLDTTGEIGFALALGGNRAWVGVRDGTLWEVTPESVLRLADLGAQVPRDVGHRGPRGDFWLGGAGGRLYHARTETSSLSGTLVVNDPAYGRIQWLAGGQLETGGYEVFAKNQEGVVLRVRGEHAEDASPEVVELHRFQIPRPGRGAGIAWIGPGEAVVGSEWSGELVFLKEGEVSFQRPPIDDNTGITAVTFIAPYRILVGSSQGSVAVLEDHWRFLGGSGIRFLVHAIVPNGASFFALGTLGYVARYDPEGIRFCEPEKLGQSSTYAAAELDDYIVLVDTNPTQQRTFARFVRR